MCNKYGNRIIFIVSPKNKAAQNYFGISFKCLPAKSFLVREKFSNFACRKIIL
jgi:hypothetical protein